MIQTTDRLFERESYLKEAKAKVIDLTPEGVILDKTIFYAESGGQPGDIGTLTLSSGAKLSVVDTRYQPGRLRIVHLLAVPPSPELIGQEVALRIDWTRREGLMRMHSALHILCGLIDAPVTGCSMHADRARLDFNLDTPPPKEELTERINAILAARLPIEIIEKDKASAGSVSDLVRTENVAPPQLGASVRLVKIGSIDLQPCGGTHVRTTGEIPELIVRKIQNKGGRNRRIELAFAG